MPVAEAHERAEARPQRYGRYPEYRDSGLEWLGEIPAHWDVRRLKHVASMRVSKLNAKPENAVYVGLEHVESWTGRLLLETSPEAVEGAVSSFVAGDVLLGKLRPYLAKAARPNFDGVCTSELLALDPRLGCLQSYLMYCLLNAPFVLWMDSLTYGARMPRVSPDQVASSCHAPLPPESEQQLVADFLDRETAKIDALVARKERLIALLQEKRAALVTQAVTKGLDPSVPMRDSGVDWLDEIPAHWKCRAVKRLFGVVNGSTPKSGEPDYWDGNIPWVTPEDLGKLDQGTLRGTARQITRRGFESCGTQMVPAGSLVLSTRAPIGHLAIAGTSLCTNQGCRSLVLRSPLIELFFYFQILAAKKELQVSGRGSTFAELAKEDLEAIALAVPPLDEQRAIANFLDHETAKLDALTAKIREAISYLAEYRAALISAAVTGKIDVREEAA